MPEVLVAFHFDFMIQEGIITLNPVCLFVCLFLFVCFLACLLAGLVWWVGLVCLVGCLVGLFVCLLVCLFVCFCFFCLFVFFVCMFVCLFVCFVLFCFVCLFVCWLVGWLVCLVWVCLGLFGFLSSLLSPWPTSKLARSGEPLCFFSSMLALCRCCLAGLRNFCLAPALSLLWFLHAEKGLLEEL